MQLNNVNRLIQEVCHSPEGVARLQAKPEEVYQEYGLKAQEIAVLNSMDGVEMTTKIGVHPILVMHFLIADNPEMAVSMSISEYPDLLED